MPSLQANFMNFIFKQMQKKKNPNVPHDYVAERKENASRQPAKLTNGNTLEEISVNGIDAEIIRPVNPNGKLIWYIHGGGFTTGSAVERREVCNFFAANYGYTVVANNYRLSPENQWPCHMDDCMKFYDGFDFSNYSKFIIMGESAGGTLSLSMGLMLRDQQKNMPSKIVAFSPCTNQADGFPSQKENAKTDYMLGDEINSMTQYKAVFGDKAYDENFRRSPYVSPYYGDYEGMPPIFLAASDTEALYDDSRSLYEKLKEEGRPVEVDIAHGICHAYPMFTFIPESRKTLEKCAEFLNKE